MINRFFYPFFFIAFSTLIYFSCANEVRPTGGPKDTIPPGLIHSTPSTKSINFKGNTLILEFDEFIKTDKLNTQLLITPRVETNYKVKASSRRVQLQFEDDNPFEPNTTYTFNFQNSIKDITESNPWKNSKIVFSTGDFLDSLYIEGHVFDHLTKKPLRNSVVSIYRAEDTLTALTGKPMYFTVTDDKGYFILENLVSNDYRMYTFNDKNNNLIIDAATESYGFLTDTLHLTESFSDIDLTQVSLNVNDLKFVSARAIRYYFDISFNKHITDYSLTPISEDVDLSSNFYDQNKKIRIYNTFSSLDSLQVEFTAKDSLENAVLDTIFIKFQRSTLPRETFTQTFSPANNKSVPRNFTGEFTFNKPIMTINYDSIFFEYDSVHFEPILSENINFNKNKDVVYINKNLNFIDPETSTSFKFYSAPGTFISVDSDTSKALLNEYKLLNPINFGTIHGTVTTNAESFIIQLLNTSFNVEKEIKNQKRFSFNNVPPGSYYLRVMIDTDKNGQWDPGNILENKPPEPVVFYINADDKIETLSIKANWEISDINITIP